jgi:hypothetical protein
MERLKIGNRPSLWGLVAVVGLALGLIFFALMGGVSCAG